MNIKSLFKFNKTSIIILIFLFIVGVIYLGYTSIGQKTYYREIGVVLIALVFVYSVIAIFLKK